MQQKELKIQQKMRESGMLKVQQKMQQKDLKVQQRMQERGMLKVQQKILT